MANVDQFAHDLLEEAKRFSEKARDEISPEGKQAYLHSAIVLGFCSFEAHINAIADDFLVRSELTVLERSILGEQDFKFDNGEFIVTDNLKMYRLTERVEFLHRRFSGSPLDKSQPYWSQLKAALCSRNELTHPKQQTVMNDEAVKQALQSILDTLEAIYQAIYKKPYPARNRGLDSTMTF
jgi:hypothetical protein